MKFRLVVLLALIGIIQIYHPTEGARILAVLPFFARSHHNFFQPLLKALARAGHDVVVYSHFPLDKPVPKYTDVILENISMDGEPVSDIVKKYMKAPHYMCLDLFVDLFDPEFYAFIESDKIQKLLTSKEHFDLVITEPFTSQEFINIFGHVFKAPVIAVQAFATNSIVNSVFGNSLSIAHKPTTCSPFSDKMTFFDRLHNTYYMWRNIYYIYYNKYITLLEQRIKKYIPDAPPILEMINNVSLVFVNDHLTADYAQPRTPNIIPVAGIHIEEEKPLPKVLQDFMDEAKDGVIFFSLGTYVPDELQPQEYFDMYNNVFRQLKQRVLWKTRKENIQGLPDNVMTVKWAPQRDILAHPNCVLFITHGGLLSQHEAVHFGVPVVVIPHFWDQHRNGRFYEEKGIGVKINNQDLSELTILSGIRKVLDSPQYSRNVKELSRIFKDRPMTPAETVVYWTEYVLRHGGAHLRPASTQLSWYQLELLDVLAVVIVIIIFVIISIFLICRRIFKFITNDRTNNVKIKKKV